MFVFETLTNLTHTHLFAFIYHLQFRRKQCSSWQTHYPGAEQVVQDPATKKGKIVYFGGEQKDAKNCISKYFVFFDVKKQNALPPERQDCVFEGCIYVFP